MSNALYFLRNFVAMCAGLAMRLTAFRFSKDYRHGTTRHHRIAYALCNTVAANYVADGLHPLAGLFWGYPSQTRWSARKSREAIQ